MRFRADLYFQTSVNLLLAVGFVSLASTGKLDLPTILCFALAYSTYFYLSVKQRLPLLTARRVSFFSRIYIVIFLIDFLWLSKSFIDAAIHLLIFIQVLKFYSEKKDRDYFYLILMAFMELLASAAMTISPAFFLWFVMFLALVISTLVSFEIKRSQENLDPLPSIRPAKGGGVSGPFPTSGRWIHGVLAATSVTLSLGIVLIASVIFFVLPRVEGGFFSRLNTPTQSITGFSTSVQFGDVGSIKRNMTLVMRVEIEGNPQDYAGVKWRGIALNTFEGNTWYRLLNQEERPLGRDSGGLYRVPPDQLPPPHRLVRYVVVLEPLNTDVLFAAAHARLIQTSSRIRIDPAGSLATEFHPNNRIRYEVVSDLGSPPVEQLRRAGNDYPRDIVQSYLQRPEKRDRIADLAREITRFDQNNYDRARSLEQYLRSHYTYTLDLPRVRESDPIGQFLFETRRGHCEYFASSMAVMLRRLSIPSRVVNGFQTGEYNAIGRDFMVREADAHSWVEAYFPGSGWVSFDPTPAVANPPRAVAWTTLLHYFDALELFWINWVVGYDSFRQVTLFQDLQRRSWNAKHRVERGWLNLMEHLGGILKGMFFAPSRRPGAVPRSQLVRERFPWVLLILVLAVIMVFLQRWFLRRRAWRTPRPPAVAEAFGQWLRAMSRRGFLRRPSQTPLEFLESISDPKLRQTTLELTRVYNRLRFQHAALDPESFKAFQSKLEMAIKDL